MCGRYILTSPVDALAALFGFETLPNLAPSWNIAPTQSAPIVGPAAANGRQLAMARWGLSPAWAKAPAAGPPLINARGETVREKPSFRDAFRGSRRLAPADGFYEWSGQGREKRAFFAKPAGPVAFAAIAAPWRGPDGAPGESFAIVTTTALGPLGEIHHRAPVVIAPADFEAWLAGPPDMAARLIRPPAPDCFEMIEVDSRVGNVRQDDPGLIQPKPASTAAAAIAKNDQMKLF